MQGLSMKMLDLNPNDFIKNERLDDNPGNFSCFSCFSIGGNKNAPRK